MHGNVGVECPHVCEAPSTLLTRKGPVLVVIMQVGLQTSPLEEALATLGTLEGLLSPVRVQMDLQTSSDAVAFVTVRTLEGLLPAVDTHVFREPVLLREAFATLYAREWLCSTVLEKVAPQVSFEPETPVTLGTLVGLLAAVDAQVFRELELLGVGLAALAAGVGPLVPV